MNGEPSQGPVDVHPRTVHPRRGGRPQIPEASPGEMTVPMMTRVPLCVYNRYARVSLKEGIPIAALIRSVLISGLGE